MSLSYSVPTSLEYFASLVRSDEHFPLLEAAASLAQDEYPEFDVQQLLGDHFAPAQDGSAWTSAAVGRLMRFWGEQGADTAALGQSSWGPTGSNRAPLVSSLGWRIQSSTPKTTGCSGTLWPNSAACERRPSV